MDNNPNQILDIYKNYLDLMNDSFQSQSPIFPDLTEEKIGLQHIMAYTYYNNKHYLEAEGHFRFLVAAVPSNSEFWKGLGACLAMRKCYTEAIHCYACAQALRIGKFDPYLEIYTADCYFSLNAIEKGLKVLEGAETLAEYLKNREVLRHIRFMKSRWKKKTRKKSQSFLAQQEKKS